MATTTSYLQLTKPALTDQFDLNVINANWDKIDTGCSKLENLDSSKIITDMNSATLQAGLYRRSSTATGGPGTAGPFLNLTSAAYITQLCAQNSTNGNVNLTVRTFRNTDAEPLEIWHRIPTFITFDSISSGGNKTVTFTMSNSYKGLLLFQQQRNEGNGTALYSICLTTGGTVYIVPIMDNNIGSSLTYTVGTNTVTFTTSSSVTSAPTFITLGGVVSNATYST